MQLITVANTSWEIGLRKGIIIPDKIGELYYKLVCQFLLESNLFDQATFLPTQTCVSVKGHFYVHKIGGITTYIVLSP